MIVFRCTQRVVKRFKLRPSESPPPSSGLLGDWYVNLLNVGSSRLVLCLSERSLLPVILPARNEVFPRQFPEFLRGVLQGLQVPSEQVEAEVTAAGEVVFGKPRSRQVLGALNDFVFCAGFQIAKARSGNAPLEAALVLAEMPSKPIGYSSPDRVALSLFQAAGLS
jgi:hypothetical protein